MKIQIKSRFPKEVIEEDILYETEGTDYISYYCY